jgi:hypothetical protein
LRRLRIRAPFAGAITPKTLGPFTAKGNSESFFGTLEAELLGREQFATHEQARRRIFSFLESVRSPTSQRQGPRKKQSKWQAAKIHQPLRSTCE